MNPPVSALEEPAGAFGLKSRAWVGIATAFLPMVTLLDYVSGFELQFSIFYMVSICLATWFSGGILGSAFSLASVAFSLWGDSASGLIYQNRLAPWWNCLFELTCYLAMVAALVRLRAAQKDLEIRIEERTAALRSEIRGRQDLERALLDVSEREQRRIGHDLHDSLGQHLTSAAIAGQVLSGKLNEKGLDEARDSEVLVQLIEDGIDLARSLARGLAPVELDALGLSAALRELARTAASRSRIPCTFEVKDDLDPENSEAVIHLFRIAQEAVNNAVRHSGARAIQIRLWNSAAGIDMRVEDDGRGGVVAGRLGRGMGLHIMRHRASLIGAQFHVQSTERGTGVHVSLPRRAGELDEPEPQNGEYRHE